MDPVSRSRRVSGLGWEGKLSPQKRAAAGPSQGKWSAVGKSLGLKLQNATLTHVTALCVSL